LTRTHAVGGRALRAAAVEPLERTLLVPENDMDHRDVIRGDVALLRQREYTIQLRTHCLGLSGQCQRLRAERVAALCLQRMLLDLVERALVVALGNEATN